MEMKVWMFSICGKEIGSGTIYQNYVDDGIGRY